MDLYGVCTRGGLNFRLTKGTVCESPERIPESNHLLQGIRVHAKELREDGSNLAVYEVMSLCTAQARASRTMTTMTACDAKALLLIWGVVSAQLWQHACL